MQKPQCSWILEFKDRNPQPFLKINADKLQVIDGNLVFTVGDVVSHVESSLTWERVSILSQETGKICSLELVEKGKKNAKT